VPGIRRIFLTPYPYLIDYQIGDDEITVLRFRHTSRDPASVPGRA
jgi:toxin ParE1/3/4